MSYDFELEEIIPGDPQQVYEAWMSSAAHTAMTRGNAEINPTIGGEYSVWDGYGTGTTILLEPPQRIVQSWRTSEFTEDDPASQIEVLFMQVPKGTRIILRHTNVPDEHLSYERDGWQTHYFDPMRAYFAAQY